MKKIYTVIGLMSGTSLDGLDIAYCELRSVGSRWEFDILEAETIAYTQVWKQLLQDAPSLDGIGLALLNSSYGHWIGQTVNQFMRKHNVVPRLISSHGHTVFHRPNERMTLQIGHGATIAAETGITTVSDFRSLNIAIGGQGAPLVPIGDRLLFGEYAACVNVGGFANISMERDKKRVAYDICPANIILNLLSNKLGMPFDASGNIASTGKVNKTIFEKLENLNYYKSTGPKSLGREWVEKEVIHLFDENKAPVEDLLSTVTQHIASQISRNLPIEKQSKVLITGGGTHNSFLIKKIKERAHCEIIIPSEKIIDFKESLIFALLGVLRVEGLVNCLAESTGASTDCSSGAIHLPPRKVIQQG